MTSTPPTDPPPSDLLERCIWAFVGCGCAAWLGLFGWLVYRVVECACG